jgi:site-specific recombinase XerD
MMTKSVRYQDGCLYADHAAWYVRYRVQVRQEDGSIKFKQRAKMLGRLESYPRESDIMPLKVEFMRRLNTGKFTPESSMNLKEFVENIYLKGELRGLEWTNYTGNSLSVTRSVWKSAVNGPKTRASAQSVPVIRRLAEILETYRLSMGSPVKGVMFHSGGGEHMDLYNLSRQIIRPAMKAIRLEWYGWHACRRGIASNLFELGANEKVVQRILRHAKPHVTKERYIKALIRLFWRR